MTYKVSPVVRDGNKLYFGEPQNPFMVVLTVLTISALSKKSSNVLAPNIISSVEASPAMYIDLKHDFKEIILFSISICNCFN